MCEGIQRIGAIEQGVMDECNAQSQLVHLSGRKRPSHRKRPVQEYPTPLYVIAHPPIQGDYSAALKGLVDGRVSRVFPARSSFLVVGPRSLEVLNYISPRVINGPRMYY